MEIQSLDLENLSSPLKQLLANIWPPQLRGLLKDSKALVSSASSASSLHRLPEELAKRLLGQAVANAKEPHANIAIDDLYELSGAELSKVLESAGELDAGMVGDSGSWLPKYSRKLLRQLADEVMEAGAFNLDDKEVNQLIATSLSSEAWRESQRLSKGTP